MAEQHALLRPVLLPILLIAVLMIVACSSNGHAPADDQAQPAAGAASEPAGLVPEQPTEPQSAEAQPEPEPQSEQTASPPATTEDPIDDAAEEDERTVATIQAATALYRTATTDQQPQRILEAGEPFDLAGRSPDGRWIAGRAACKVGRDGCEIDGWIESGDTIGLPLDPGDLPLFAGLNTLLVIDADSALPGSGPETVLISSTGTPVSEPDAPGFQPWFWGGEHTLAYLDGSTIRIVDVHTGDQHTIDGLAAIDFDLSPDAQRVIVVTEPGTTNELWLADPT